MRGSTADRTKVVLRQLPPTITEAMLMDQIDISFSGRYNWVSFRPGSSSQKQHSYSRAYINFQKPEDVIEFAEFFGGHVFVNEKGTQFKTVVEYSPSQRVPQQLSKKDGREGTIYKDPEYVEFLELISKPVENLPSAEIQLERREAERAGAAKDVPIVTPLMQFIRQKRASKAGPRRSLSNGKPTRRIGGTSGSPSSASLKRGSDKKRVSSTMERRPPLVHKSCYDDMYVLRDTAKSTLGKDKSPIMVSKRDDQQNTEKSVLATASGIENLEAGSVSGVSGTTEIGKKKILLLKGKEKEIRQVSDEFSLQQMSSPSPIKNSTGVSAVRPNPRHEASGKIIRSILLNKDSRQNSSVAHSEMEIQTSNQEKDKRLPRLSNVQLVHRATNGVPGDRVANVLHGSSTEKQEKCTRNRDRPDRGVWAPLRRSDGLHASDDSLSSSTSQNTQSLLEPAEAHGETKTELLRARSGDLKHTGSGHIGHLPFDNGSYKHGGRRGPGLGPSHNGKEADGSLIVAESKSLKRGASSGYGSHEKQVWVQKSSSGS